MSGMTHIETENICASLDKFPQHLRRFRRWSQGANNPGLPRFAHLAKLARSIQPNKLSSSCFDHFLEADAIGTRSHSLLLSKSLPEFTAIVKANLHRDFR